MIDLMKIPLPKLKKKIWNEFSLFIRRRDKFKCFTCGYIGYEKDGVMQAGHLLTCDAESTRFDELNVHCQCVGCNFLNEQDFEIYRRCFVKVYGEIIYDKLYRKHHTVKKYTRGELIALLEHYKNLNKGDGK